MGKVQDKYLIVDPFKIIEEGFHKQKNQVSESIFSLCNEYVGVRGTFEEGSSLPSLIGTYFNGIYEYALEDTPNAYKGIIKRTHFTINSVNFFKLKIKINNTLLDLGVVDIDNFKRILDMRNGLLTRKFIWKHKDADIDIKFERILDMNNCHNALQRISFIPNNDVQLDIDFCLDNSILHWGKDNYYKDDKTYEKDNCYGISAKTLSTHQSIASFMKIDCQFTPTKITHLEKEIIVSYSIKLSKNNKTTFVRYINNNIDKHNDNNIDELVNNAYQEVNNLSQYSFDEIVNNNKKYYDEVWGKSDIEIIGNDEDQQGIRYCIFQLEQNYHGYAEDNNIGAKGLTGEAYSGHAFWDSETYCLPYYLFSNKKAALDLLMFRFNTLPQAKERAKMLDCVGACYPIATRNGEEGCNLWQHASCQFQPTTAVGYAIFHYMNIYNDREFMQNYGLEMMMEICKFLLSRGQYNSSKTGFGYYGVMGPDEFELFVNNNTYTNYLAKKNFDYLFKLLDDNYDVEQLKKKCGITDELLSQMKEASSKMIILYNDETKLFEQHDGYYQLPHIDISSIPVTDFPLYSHWSYDRIYRNDIIKQPDVLMFMFLYPHDFSFEQKKNNYEYYEPRCLHESSLSPSVHSIFACELKKEKQALDFFSFATRLDLDDYNRNTCEGLHMTSIAAAWMNIVYGFLGLKSDKPMLEISPMIPDKWQQYSVHLNYLNTNIKIIVQKDKILFETNNNDVVMKIYDKETTIYNGLVVYR